MNKKVLLFLTAVSLCTGATSSSLLSWTKWSTRVDSYGSTVTNSTPIVSNGVATGSFLLESSNSSTDEYTWGNLVSKLPMGSSNTLSSVTQINLTYKSRSDFSIVLIQPPLDQSGESYRYELPASTDYRTISIAPHQFSQPVWADAAPLNLSNVRSLSFQIDGDNGAGKSGTINVSDLTLENYSGTETGGFPLEFNINATAGANGSIFPSGDMPVEEGRGVSFKISPERGYQVEDVTVNGESHGAVRTLDLTGVSKDLEVIATFKAKETQPKPYEYNGALNLRGTQIINQHGTPIQLRGMSTHGLQWHGDFITDNAMDALADEWGSDIIRLSLYAHEGGYIYGNRVWWKNRIDQLVDMASARGMYVILDWHMLNPGDPMWVIDDAKEYFTYMAQTHGGKANVIFEICNEPNDYETPSKKLPYHVAWYDGGNADLKSYADALIKVIRDNDPDQQKNLIICGTPDWASSPNDVIGHPVEEPDNVLYTFHFYADDADARESVNGQKSDYMKKFDEAFAAGIPIFVTEFGTQNPQGDGPHNEESSTIWLNMFKERKISWCNWNFSPDGLTGAAFQTWMNSSASVADLSNENNMKTAGKWIFNRLQFPEDNWEPEVELPVITDQKSLSTPEEQALTISLSDLFVTDPANSYPSGFSLVVTDGNNYSVNGAVITPSPNFEGTLQVPVKVNNGSVNSKPYTLSVSVTGVNDKPEITAQAVLTTPEATPLEVTLADLTVSDPDNNFPADFTLTLGAGDNYSVSGAVVTPADNFNGTLTVPVTVNDGELDSDIFNLAIEVTVVNDIPVITGQTVITTPEESTIEIAADHILVTDNDNSYPADFTITLGSGDNFTFTGLTITPALDFNGTLTVPVTVNDGTNNSLPFDLSIEVTAVNDKPVITDQTVLSTDEEVALTVTLANLTVTDVDNTYPTGFTMTLADGDDYTVNGNVITPAVDFNGTLTVPVTVNDGELDSDVFNLSVEVIGGNDIPVITAQNVLTTPEETAISVTLADLTVTDADNAYPADFTLALADGEDYTVDGTEVTPALDFNGTLTVSVTVNDGTNNSLPFDLSIEVTSVNDKPVITAQTVLTTDEEVALTVTLANLTVTDVDNTYPTGFTMNLADGDNYTVTGTEITPAVDFNGTLTVPVTVNDGELDSDIFNLSVEVIGGNDIPVITAQNVLTTPEENAISVTLADLTVTDADNSYPVDFTLALSDGEDYTVNGTEVTPALNFNGTLTVPVTVNDGTNSSAPFNLEIEVTPVNDKPVITAQTVLTTDEEVALTVTLANLTVTDVDNTYPTGFTMTLADGDNYTVTGTEITPAAGFNGTLTVPVTVNDGTEDSDLFNLSVNVSNVNDIPVIIAQSEITCYKNRTYNFTLGDITVEDNDNSVEDFTLTLLDGDNYTVENNIISPATDFTGTISVDVIVSDGTDESAPYTVTISVKPPVALVDASTIPENELALTPNPAQPSYGEKVNFKYSGEEHFASAEVRIFDVTGNLLTVLNSNYVNGTFAEWDGKTRAGRIVASGSYVALIRFTKQDGTMSFSKQLIGIRQ